MPNIPTRFFNFPADIVPLTVIASGLKPPMFVGGGGAGIVEESFVRLRSSNCISPGGWNPDL